MEPLALLARVLVNVPDNVHVTTRYYGWYANRPRGMRDETESTVRVVPPPIVTRAATETTHRRGALLQQLFEVEPLACPACHEAMRVVDFSTQVSVIDLRSSPRSAPAPPRPPARQSPVDPRATRRPAAAPAGPLSICASRRPPTPRGNVVHVGLHYVSPKRGTY